MEFNYLPKLKKKQFHKRWIKINGKTVINFSSNNFLGLDNNPSILRFINKKIIGIGFGFSTGPGVYGIHKIHRKLEKTVSGVFETESAILNSSCYETNIGLFPAILSANDAVFSDSLNHASTIDGIRLCKAKRFIFPHRDYSALEKKLQDASEFKLRLIVTNGAFSMDGTIANLKKIKELAVKYNALVMVDETFALGILGKKGKGSAEYYNLTGNIDIITGSFGTALGGFNGGFATGRKNLIDKIRQNSRTYHYSSLIAPASVFAAQKALRLLMGNHSMKAKLEKNVKYFKNKMRKNGFFVIDNPMPVIPIIFKNEEYGRQTFEKLLKNGVYASFFTFPVVPKGASRLRIEISAIHSKSDIDLLVKNISLIIDPNKVISLH